MKKIGVLFGMENTFPGALVERINAMKLPDIVAEFVQIGGVPMAEPSGYDVIVDRISHDIPFYRAYLKNAALTGTDRHQQPVLVERRRQVLQLRAGAQARRRRFRRRCCCRTSSTLPAPPTGPCATCSTRSTGTASSSYVGFPAFLKPFDGGGWRDVYKVQHAGRVLRRLRPDRRPLHDAAARRQIQGVLPLLRGRIRRRCTSCPTIRARPFHERYVQESAGLSDPELLARVERDCADAVPRARLRPEHRGVRRARTAFPTPSTS